MKTTAHAKPFLARVSIRGKASFSRLGRCILVGFLIFAGCGDEAGVGTSDDVASVAQAAIPNLSSTCQITRHTFADPWTEFLGPGPNYARYLHPASTHLCVLHRVSGNMKFGTWDASVGLESDGRWSLRKRGEMTGQASCFTHSCFSAASPNPIRGASDGFLAHAVAKTSGVILPSCETDVQATLTWPAQAATILQAVGSNGSIRGCGESTWIDQKSAIGEWSLIYAQDKQCDSCPEVQGVFKGCGPFGRANSFYIGSLAGFLSDPAVGAPPNGFSAWYGPNTTLGNASQAGEYHVSSGGPTTAWMAPVREAMCFFTKVCGWWNGGGEFAEIRRAHDGTTERWRLQVQHLSGSGVFASARCFRRHQPWL